MAAEGWRRPPRSGNSTLRPRGRRSKPVATARSPLPRRQPPSAHLRAAPGPAAQGKETETAAGSGHRFLPPPCSPDEGREAGSGQGSAARPGRRRVERRDKGAAAADGRRHGAPSLVTASPASLTLRRSPRARAAPLSAGSDGSCSPSASSRRGMGNVTVDSSLRPFPAHTFSGPLRRGARREA